MKISKSNLFIIVVIVGTYIVWFVFFQDVIKFILNNAIESETGEIDIVTGWLGVIILPALIAFCLMGIIAGIYALIQRAKKNDI
ncbi:MAG: hypothetical protein ACFFCV_17170 [Promethearchaeota archaeon]